MRLEHYSQEKLKKEILEIIGKHLNIKEYNIFFFGSRVSGKGDDRADIDVGIEGKESVPSTAFLDIQEEIENLPTLYIIDVVDFAQVDQKFKDVASQHVEALN